MTHNYNLVFPTAIVIDGLDRIGIGIRVVRGPSARGHTGNHRHTGHAGHDRFEKWLPH
ncbi:hypothetical protein PL976_08710 [Bifidobacterium adolescentis]|nr:hypothetical protein [Bifidobacterium adolescentis]MDB1535481.1 hypothetical protein [Bifidobacterium adolescentis]MDB1539112.1 hypothetical protein [Bifidobacterium adolescentis]MDB1544240.1 hypothetical protein [Bifidobacterium adolescentis]